MALLSIIRRWPLRDGMPIREIARRTGLSRNTVRKYLAKVAFEKYFLRKIRTGDTAPYYENMALKLLGIDKLK